MFSGTPYPPALHDYVIWYGPFDITVEIAVSYSNIFGKPFQNCFLAASYLGGLDTTEVDGHLCNFRMKSRYFGVRRDSNSALARSAALVVGCVAYTQKTVSLNPRITLVLVPMKFSS